MRLLMMRGGPMVLALVVAFSRTLDGADERDPAAKAQQDATVMYEAFVRGDLVTFASYTHPALVRMAGGPEGLAATIGKGMAEMATQGSAFKSATIGMPSQVVTAGREVQAVLPMTIVMTVPGGELHTKSHLVGVSGDAGQTWTFLDTAKGMTALRSVVPTLSSELTIPAKQKPTFMPK